MCHIELDIFAIEDSADCTVARKAPSQQSWIRLAFSGHDRACLIHQSGPKSFQDVLSCPNQSILTVAERPANHWAANLSTLEDWPADTFLIQGQHKGAIQRFEVQPRWCHQFHVSNHSMTTSCAKCWPKLSLSFERLSFPDQDHGLNSYIYLFQGANYGKLWNLNWSFAFSLVSQTVVFEPRWLETVCSCWAGHPEVCCSLWVLTCCSLGRCLQPSLLLALSKQGLRP